MDSDHLGFRFAPPQAIKRRTFGALGSIQRPVITRNVDFGNRSNLDLNRPRSGIPGLRMQETVDGGRKISF